MAYLDAIRLDRNKAVENISLTARCVREGSVHVCSVDMLSICSCASFALCV